MSSIQDEDDLDAFFRAAENDDHAALTQAADQVASGGAAGRYGESSPHGIEQDNVVNLDGDAFREGPPRGFNRNYRHSRSGEAKFTAMEPQNADAGGAPFVLVPYSIPSMLPWWVWASVVIMLCGIFLAVMFIPRIELSSLTAHLGGSQASAQSAMRQLVMRGDENTVNGLYEFAASQSQDINARLRAIDTLSLIAEPEAERALLRLELAEGTDPLVRRHAIAARKQREAGGMRLARER